MANLLVDVLYHYRERHDYLLHEFVAMPNHLHLLITPAESLERALQLIKGGFSYRANRELQFVGLIWQNSFYDRRVRDAAEYSKMSHYIRENPVRAGLAACAEDYRYSSANPRWPVDEVPQRLKPLAAAAASSQR